MKKKRWLQKMTVWICVMCFLCPVMTVRAGDLDNLQNQSSGLQSELDSINGELLEIGEQIAKNEVELESINGNITKTQAQLEIAKNNEAAHYADMKVRIQYIYENQGDNLLGMILSAQSLADFVNKVHFVQTLSNYDRDMFQDLQKLRYTIEEEEQHLKEQQESYMELEQTLNAKRDELNAKAQATSTDLGVLESRIQELKKQQMAEQMQSNPNNQNQNHGSQGQEETPSSPEGNGNQENNNGGSDGGWQPGDGYIYPSGPGQLNPWVGVVYFNGHKETYYSQKILPGYGLYIPGRHVVQDGTIRDENGYLCLASSDHPKGTVVETSLGTGIVYDTGCASGVIDIYTDW